MVGPSDTSEEPGVILGAGTRLGKYQVVRLVGTGGMGSVYEGFHTEMGKRVAIKILSPAIAAVPGARARFLREAQLTSRVRHPNIVDVTDMGSEEGQTYLVMELLHGEDLSQRLGRSGPLPTQELVDIMLPVCSAVVAAHQVGVTHRDLKPQNIFLAEGPHTIHPKVLDFGISKGNDAVNAGSLTGTGAMVGTPFYLSPEQVLDARSAGPQSDQYALGVILYECLTGHRPFDSESLFVVLQAIVGGAPPRPRQYKPDISPVLEEIVLHAMNLDPHARFPSTQELGRALLPFASVRSRSIWGEAFRGSGTDPGLDPGHDGLDVGGPKPTRFATPPVAAAIASKVATPSTLRQWPSTTAPEAPPGTPATAPEPRSGPSPDSVPTEPGGEYVAKPAGRFADTRSLDRMSLPDDGAPSDLDDGAPDGGLRARRWFRVARVATVAGLVLAGAMIAVVALRKSTPRVKVALGSPAASAVEAPVLNPPPGVPAVPAVAPPAPTKPEPVAATNPVSAPPLPPPSAPAAAEPAVAEPATAAPIETYAISVTVDPDTAAILLDGAQIGVGHVERTLPLDHQRHVMRFTNDGFLSRRLAFRDVPPPEHVTLTPRDAARPDTDGESLMPRPGRRADPRGSMPRSLNPNGAPVID